MIIIVSPCGKNRQYQNIKKENKFHI